MTKEKFIEVADPGLGQVFEMTIGDVGGAVSDYMEDDEEGALSLSKILQGKNDKSIAAYIVKNIQDFPTIENALKNLLQEVCSYVKEIAPDAEAPDAEE